MDTLTYDFLLQKTKLCLIDTALISEVSFPSNFRSLLEDCRLCLIQSFDMIVNLMLHDNIQVSKLTEYMEDAVCLLHYLTNHIKTVVESISMSCCSYKTFPTTTGHIIMLVFTHCKTSESVYGSHLNMVQKQLKDLFRSCHELQLVYLMVLEKNFMFDLTKEEQLDTLIEALNINLKIGEVVQSLDVKTMAEQWKGYLALSEKYSSHLMDTHVYQECAELLCNMITNNFKNALEVNQDDKLVIRSLKVTNFTMKILLKIYNIFKHVIRRNDQQIIQLLIYISLNNPTYLELVEGKQPQFISATNTYVCIPSDCLLRELVMDDTFIKAIIHYDINKLDDLKRFGFVYLLVAVIKSTLINDTTPNYPKHELMITVYNVLPHSQVWLNMGLKFKNELNDSTKTIGIYELILIYTTSLALTMDTEDMGYLEKLMYESLLGIEPVTAIFSSNLWVSLSRISNNRSMLLSQVMSLCHIYKKLDGLKIFSLSPQKAHITHTLSALFELLCNQDKTRIYKQFNPLESESNMSLWSAIEIRLLPKDLQRNMERQIFDNNTMSMANLQFERSNELIHTMKLTATCDAPGDSVEDFIVQAWVRACPERCRFLSSTLDAGTLWYHEYLAALVTWTDRHVFYDARNVAKVLRVMSNITKIANKEVNILLIKLFCKLAATLLANSEEHFADISIEETIKNLVQDNCIRNVLFFTLTIQSGGCTKFENIVYGTLDRNSQIIWNEFQKSEINLAVLKDRLSTINSNKFVHKCLETKENIVSLESDLCQKSGSNFDFADIDTLFDTESDSEPASKRQKVDTGEVECILEKLENDTATLCNVKENVFTGEQKNRIQVVCEKLRSIVK